MKAKLVCAFFIFVDFLTKYCASDLIPPLKMIGYPFGGVGIFDWNGITFSLNYVVNTGAAWGTFSGFAGLLFILRALIILFIFIWVPKRWPIWLILAGAIGNGIDYCLYGHVIDFFHFTFWGYSFPIFNIADACITIGVLSLILFSQKERPKFHES